jgi:hypothetical protein
MKQKLILSIACIAISCMAIAQKEKQEALSRNAR